MDTLKTVTWNILSSRGPFGKNATKYIIIKINNISDTEIWFHNFKRKQLRKPNKGSFRSHTGPWN